MNNKNVRFASDAGDAVKEAKFQNFQSLRERISIRFSKRKKESWINLAGMHCYQRKCDPASCQIYDQGEIAQILTDNNSIFQGHFKLNLQ